MEVIVCREISNLYLSDEAFDYMGIEKDYCNTIDLGKLDKRLYKKYKNSNYKVIKKAIRTHPKVIDCLKKLGEKAIKDEFKNKLGWEIVNIPDEIDFNIELAGCSHDKEKIVQKHLEW